MKLKVDSHTHSVASGHAYSTVQEMAAGAKARGLKMFALTDHGPAMPGGPYIYHFMNLRVLPPVIAGVRVIKAAEVNIMDSNGRLDMEPEALTRLEYAVASLHEICITKSDVNTHTEALINALKNPYIDAIGHPGNPYFPVNITRVVETAKEFGKCIEVNNASFFVRAGSEENCREFIRECIRLEVPIVCGSDAHVSFDVGKFDHVEALIRELKIPERLLMCASVENFESVIAKRKKRIG